MDIEFTVNFDAREKLGSTCSSAGVPDQGHYSRVELPEKIAKTKILIRQEANFMGGSIYQAISRIIYVDPQAYAKLPLPEKYEIARLVGKLNRQIGRRDAMPTILLGRAAEAPPRRQWAFRSSFRDQQHHRHRRNRPIRTER